MTNSKKHNQAWGWRLFILDEDGDFDGGFCGVTFGASYSRAYKRITESFAGAPLPTLSLSRSPEYDRYFPRVPEEVLLEDMPTVQVVNGFGGAS